MNNNMRAKLTKREIKQRRKYLTEDGYRFIITAVQRIHGVTLSKRTVDAYLRSEKVPKTGKRRKDIYGILPLFALSTDAEKEVRNLKLQTLTEKLEA
jgi:hypothetical protein